MDEQRLLATVEELYEAVTDPRRLRLVGNLLQRAMEVESCIVFTARHDDGQLVDLLSASANFDDNARAEYRAHYHARNPWYQGVAGRAPPFVVRGEEILDYRDFDRTEFCADWCSRVGIYHMMGGVAALGGGVVAACGVHAPRGAGPFGDERKRRFDGLMRHLGRACRLAEAFGTLHGTQALSARLLEDLRVGVMLLDSRCAPVLVNRVAESLLGTSRWFALRGSRVRPVHPACASQFEHLVARAAGAIETGVLSLRDPLEGRLAVLVAPFRAAALGLGTAGAVAVVFLDPAAGPVPTARAIAQVYGLTRAEARLVAELAHGRNVVQAARASGISPHTAKSQLRSVFARTGFSRQVDLVAAVLAHPVLRTLSAPASSGRRQAAEELLQRERDR